MNIKTKFNVGDHIFTIKDCEVKEIVVDKIVVFVDNDGEHIYYHEGGLLTGAHADELNAYASREELVRKISGFAPNAKSPNI
ncbi:MAG: hypothetical protein ACFN4H_03775 [Prevotella sp.]